MSSTQQQQQHQEQLVRWIALFTDTQLPLNSFSSLVTDLPEFAPKSALYSFVTLPDRVSNGASIIRRRRKRETSGLFFTATEMKPSEDTSSVTPDMVRYLMFSL
jgi:hypothetical protein